MSPGGKTVAIVQSNYVPWKGYFDLIDAVDEFILLDDVQYTRRDWRNRNLIKTPQGTRWLTIPVLNKGRYEQMICHIRVADREWPLRHWNLIRENYRAAPFFDGIGGSLSNLYDAAAEEDRLSAVNFLFITAITEMLGIETPISWSMDYEVEGEKSHKLVGLCEAAGANQYLSGPTARAYLDESLFAARDIAVHYMDYSHYRAYPQLHGEFTHQVSILDMLFNLGAGARRYLNRGAQVGTRGLTR